MSITEFLIWLSSSAGATTALSFVAERSAWFRSLSGQAKSNIMLIGSALIAVVAYAVLTYTPPEVLAQLVPWFQVLYGVVGAWIANQFAHKQDPAKK